MTNTELVALRQNTVAVNTVMRGANPRQKQQNRAHAVANAKDSRNNCAEIGAEWDGASETGTISQTVTAGETASYDNE